MARKYGTTVYVNAKWRMMLRLKGTVILQIWWHILLVGIYSTIVFLISKYSDWKMNYTLVIHLYQRRCSFLFEGAPSYYYYYYCYYYYDYC
jgi:hypothetical protein